MKLSVLIPSLVSRKDQLENLVKELCRQVEECNAFSDVEVLTNIDNGEQHTGAKRQELLERAIGDYIVYVDDDDSVYPCYISEMLKACDSGADCFAINGIMTTNGQDLIQWFISKDYEDVTVKDGRRKYYQRFTNHITAVKRSIALQAGFPLDKSNAEDKAYSMGLRGKLHTEYKIEPPLYHYDFSTFNKSYT